MPMIVVVPDAHALPPEATPMTNPDFWANFNEYLGEKPVDGRPGAF